MHRIADVPDASKHPEICIGPNSHLTQETQLTQKMRKRRRVKSAMASILWKWRVGFLESAKRRNHFDCISAERVRRLRSSRAACALCVEWIGRCSCVGPVRFLPPPAGGGFMDVITTIKDRKARRGGKGAHLRLGADLYDGREMTQSAVGTACRAVWAVEIGIHGRRRRGIPTQSGRSCTISQMRPAAARQAAAS